MSMPATAPVTRWPFFLGDALLVGFALLLFFSSRAPGNTAMLIAATVCVALGAWLGVMPFLMEDRALRRREEAEGLAGTITQIQNLEAVGARISEATAQWQSIHEHASKAAAAARTTSETMNTEMKSFIEFFEKANDAERQHLRLEVDKLRRGEQDWAAVLVRIMDHVYAIHAAAVRAGQPNVVRQLTQFQEACRDAARRVGLVPFEIEPGTPFDPERHLTSDGKTPEADAKVAATLATGYTLRGQKIRPALVQLEGEPASAGAPQASEPPPPAGETEQNLPL